MSIFFVNCIGFYDYESGFEKFEIGVGSIMELVDVYLLFEYYYMNILIRVFV